MIRFLKVLILTALLLATYGTVIAQTGSESGNSTFQITYDETQRRLFNAVDEQFSERWQLIDTMNGDIPVIRVTRISGQVDLQLRLYDRAGDLKAESAAGAYTDTAGLIFENGLIADEMPYQIEVVGSNAVNENINPVEYSLTVQSDGRQRQTVDDDIETLHQRLIPDGDSEGNAVSALQNLQTLPVFTDLNLEATIEDGEPQSVTGLSVDVYGGLESREGIASITLQTPSDLSVTINQADSTEVGLDQIVLGDDGIGLSFDGTGLNFVSDTSFSVSYSDATGQYTFTIDDGAVIRTSFTGLSDIQVRGNLTELNFTNGNQRIITDRSILDIQTTGSGLYNVTLVDETITTAPDAWDILAIIGDYVRVYGGTNARFISDVIPLNITGSAESGQQQITVPVIRLDGTEDTATLNLNWHRFNDVTINRGMLYTLTRNSVLAGEFLDEIDTVETDDGAVRFARSDGTFRTVFPDSTDISTRATLADNSNLLPYETGFRTRNYNNLGDNILPACPCSSDVQSHVPVNPANGNFFYSVTDIDTIGQPLALDLNRYYNSHDSRYVNGISTDSRLTPRYLISGSSVPYPRFGRGWRHSFQYELDISSEPLGRITFIEPDGTGHYFFPDAGGTQWNSFTLLSARLFREAGTFGAWRIETTDGIAYSFDRVGRLTRIAHRDTSILLTKTSRTNFNDEQQASMFVVDNYGRRLELTYNSDSLIISSRDVTLSTPTTYTYSGNALIGVSYNSSPTRTATYNYSDFGLLQFYDDVRSPYTQRGQLTYYPDNRIENFFENPGQDRVLQREYLYIYPEITPDTGERTISRIFEVSGERRVQDWTYNPLWQLVNVQLPRDSWNYEFTYDPNSGTLQSVLVPTDVRFNLAFDNSGNLRRFEDPAFTGESAYNFEYEQRGNRSLLTNIRYPNDQVETFTWSNDDDPVLLSHSILITRTPDLVSRVRQFQYDDEGRLVTLIEPDNSAIAYTYDPRGYVASMTEGIVISDGELNMETATTTRITYSLDGQIQSIRDSNDTLYSFTRDGTHLTGITVNGEGTIRYDYNDRGLIQSINDRGVTRAFQYNGLDLIEVYLDERVGQTNYQYDEASNLVTVINAAGEETTFTFNVLDQMTLRREANGATSIFDHRLDLERNLILRSETDTSGRRMVRRYDFLGRLTLFSIFAADNPDAPFQEFRFEYNSGAGQFLTGIVETITGRVINIGHNLDGNIRTITQNDSQVQFTYTEQGYLASVTGTGGERISYEYDSYGNIIAVTLADGTSWTYEYDSQNLINVTNPRDETSRYVYDRLNRLISISSPLNETESYTYDNRGNLLTIADANEPPATTTYAYTNDNQVSQISISAGADGNRILSLFEYDTLGQLREITDARTLNTTRITYDEVGNVIAVNAARQRTLYSYDALGRITSVTDPAGHTTSYEYDAVGGVIRTQDALGNTGIFTRATGTNFVRGYTDEAGRRYEITNDTQRQVVSIRLLSEDRSTDLFYDDSGNIIRIETGFGQVHQYNYSATGQPVDYTDPVGGRWQLIYNAGDQLAQVINPAGVATTYVYDDAQRVTAVIHAVDTDVEYTELFEYDASGNITAYEIPDVIRHEYTYNILNQPGTATLAVNSDQPVQYQFLYDNSDKLSRIFTPEGSVLQFGYSLDDPDEIARFVISDSQDSDNSLNTLYEYDIAGNLIGVTIPGNDEDINLSYDALDRRVRYVDSADNSWAYTYDAADNIAQISDPLGSAVTYIYDNYDRVTGITFPSGTEIVLNYDAVNGTIASVVSPTGLPNDAIIPYELDAAGRLTGIGYNPVNSIQLEYDAIGNIVRRVAADGVATTYRYDAAGRLLEATYSDGTDSIQYAYDIQGNRTRIGDIAVRYDVFGNITEIADNDTIRYQYNQVGQLVSQESDVLEAIKTYAYDGLNRVTAITYGDAVIGITYENDTGLVSGYTRGNIETQIGYDENNRVSDIVHLNNLDPGALPLIVFTYDYDAVGNLVRVERVDDRNNTTEINYSYDIDQRLISERWLGADGETRYIVTYTYDEAGNRVEENRNGRVTTYIYNNQNQLVRERRNLSEDEFLMLPSILMGLAGLVIIRRRRKLWILLPVVSGLWVSIALAQTTSQITLEYTYDLNSNLTSVRYIGDENYVLDYRYDTENRLIGVSGQILSFADDGDEIGIDVDTAYTYDEISRITRIRTLNNEYDLFYDGHTLTGISDGETLEQYVTFNGQQVLTITGQGETRWNLMDRQGSTWRFTDADASIIEDLNRQYEFGAFGTRIFPDSPDLAPRPGARVNRPIQFFAGELYDPSTRLYLMGMRAYDPTIGRFLQPDPVRHDPVGSLYTYARNRPLNYVDPTGMIVEPLTSSIDLSAVTNDLMPGLMIPQPEMESVPPPPSFAQQQADSYFRALELVDSVRGVNTPIIELSSFYDDLYLFAVNPSPSNLSTQREQSLQRMMAMYEDNRSWQPDLIPQPARQNNPFTVLDDLMVKIAPATIEPLAFTLNQSVQTDILPEVVLPEGLTQQQQVETQLIQQLQPIQLLPAAAAETDRLLNQIPPDIMPQVVMPTLELPQVVIEPAIMTNLDDLREQTFGFYDRIQSINPGDCDDCVPPLGFNR